MTDTNKLEQEPRSGLSDLTVKLERTGYNSLWLWFSLSYASWLTMPRVLMHEMPDDWQDRMAQLLREWDDAWDTSAMPNTRVQAIGQRGKITRFPAWINNYRHPNMSEIDEVRSNVGSGNERINND
jgi:hypothetical protein